jgi:hypothetical protein
MDEETARWVRVEAAKAGKSVSRFVGELLAARRSAETEASRCELKQMQKQAMAEFLAGPLRPISDNGKLPTREELYDEVLRRHERAGVREGQQGAFKTKDGK